MDNCCVEKSEKGSSKRTQEDEAYFYLATFLQKCEGEAYTNPIIIICSYMAWICL